MAQRANIALLIALVGVFLRLNVAFRVNNDCMRQIRHRPLMSHPHCQIAGEITPKVTFILILTVASN